MTSTTDYTIVVSGTSAITRWSGVEFSLGYDEITVITDKPRDEIIPLVLEEYNMKMEEDSLYIPGSEETVRNFYMYGGGKRIRVNMQGTGSEFWIVENGVNIGNKQYALRIIEFRIRDLVNDIGYYTRMLRLDHIKGLVDQLEQYKEARNKLI